MTRDNHAVHERAVELLCSYATEGLSDVELKELDSLLADSESGIDADDKAAFELAAAEIDVSLAGVDESVPAGLLGTLEKDAAAFFAAGDAGDQPAAVPFPSPRDAGRDLSPSESSHRRGTMLPWLAAAAALFLAFAGWWQVLVPEQSSPQVTLALAYQSFAEATPDVVKLDWGSNEKDFSAVRGDILWSDTEQRGYMRFFGLPANDPTVSQYQLWIVDPSRDEHPIDGGVFDVSVADGEVIVEFESRLPADAPAVFAVTVEKPGGVVVSDGPLVLVASKSS